jgi:gamma-glutamylaminecyclotransferase
LSFKRIFVYGTLKSGFPNHALNHGRRLSGEYTTVDAYPLYLVGERYSPWLVDLPGEGTPVTGELYELDKEALLCMDELERVGMPGGYKRRIVEVIQRPHGQPQSAFVYLKAPAQLSEAKVISGPLAYYELTHAEAYRRRI